MNVCVKGKGNAPEKCLLLGIPDKDEIARLLRQPLPWCLGPFAPPKAEAMRSCFVANGGEASTGDGCAGCVAAASSRDLSAALELLERSGDRRAQWLADERAALTVRAAGAASKSLELAGAESSSLELGETGAEGVLVARTWAASLRAQIADAQTSIARLTRRVRTADRLQLIASLIGAGSVTALVAIIAGTTSKATQLTAAAIAMVAGWISSFSEQLRRNFLGNSRAKQLEDLIGTYATAESVATQLELWIHASPRPPLPTALVDQAAKLVSDFIAARNT